MSIVSKPAADEQLARLVRALRLEMETLRFLADVKGAALPATAPEDTRQLLARVYDGTRALEEYRGKLAAALSTHPHLSRIIAGLPPE